MHALKWTLAIALALAAGTAGAQENGAAPTATATPAQAQPPAATPPAVDPRKVALIRQLMDVTGVSALAVQMMDGMIESQRKANPEIDAAFWNRLQNKVAAADLTALVVPIYDRHFSVQDLEATLAFYRSPTGQRVIQEMPAVMKESMAVGQDWGKQLAQQIVTDLQAEQATAKTKRM